MDYYEIKVSASTAGLELLTALLSGYGIASLSVEDPNYAADVLARGTGIIWDYLDAALLRPGGLSRPREAVAAFYLEENSQNAELLNQLIPDIKNLRRLESGDGLGSFSVEVSTRADSEWNDLWKLYFKPLRMTERLTVKPRWEQLTPGDGELIIEIDPGMAFGTGRHETTALCAVMLEAAVWPGAKVLDIGCGSGILSIAAVLLGAGEVLGVEIDETALGIARENIRLNGCDSRARVLRGDLTRGIDFQADIVTANLVKDLIITLARDAGGNMRPGGVFIASGILDEEGDEVVSALADSGFKLVSARESGGWRALMSRRRE